jgi:hypothetical protein
MATGSPTTREVVRLLPARDISPGAGICRQLIWAREHDCPWNELSVRAEAFGHREVLRWLDEHGDCGGTTHDVPVGRVDMLFPMCVQL